MNKRKKHFAKLRAGEIRRNLPTKAKNRNQMSTYLKNMAGYKHKVVKGSETRTEESSKRPGDELEFDMSKKQKIDEHVEVEKDDPEEEEMKKHMEIIQKLNIKFRRGLLGLKDFKMILRVTTAQLQLLSDYYCWKEYADRDEIKD
ncbi:hypothetical protein Tco_0643665 [Tanacetum coccineum]